MFFILTWPSRLTWLKWVTHLRSKQPQLIHGNQQQTDEEGEMKPTASSSSASYLQTLSSCLKTLFQLISSFTVDLSKKKTFICSKHVKFYYSSIGREKWMSRRCFIRKSLALRLYGEICNPLRGSKKFPPWSPDSGCGFSSETGRLMRWSSSRGWS